MLLVGVGSSDDRRRRGRNQRLDGWPYVSEWDWMCCGGSGDEKLYMNEKIIEEKGIVVYT